MPVYHIGQWSRTTCRVFNRANGLKCLFEQRKAFWSQTLLGLPSRLERWSVGYQVSPFSTAKTKNYQRLTCVGLISLEVGPPLLESEDRSQGFDLGWVAVLESVADIQLYADHPEHLE